MEEFEDLVCRYVGQSFGVAVSSGTAGLHLCIRALGIGAGDEVIVPSFTFVAAANAVRYEGAIPVLVDIEPRCLNLDPARIEAAITPRTRAIIAVHTFGCPADMQAILDIANRHQLRVIEDACEAIGAMYQGRHVGTFGDAAVFAFYPNKQITTGEGGMVVTKDPRLAREIRAMRNHGRYESDEWHQHSILGYNYRLSEINCALGCAQMRRIPEILSLREQVARRYDALLRDMTSLVLPPTDLPAATQLVCLCGTASRSIQP
jgi:perosamine synthetase